MRGQSTWPLIATNSSSGIAARRRPSTAASRSSGPRACLQTSTSRFPLKSGSRGRRRRYTSDWRGRPVIALVADANLDGHADLLRARLRSDAWREFDDALQIQVLHFEDIGLDRTAPDDVVWRLCQVRGYYLLTANRNR